MVKFITKGKNSQNIRHSKYVLLIPSYSTQGEGVCNTVVLNRFYVERSNVKCYLFPHKIYFFLKASPENTASSLFAVLWVYRILNLMAKPGVLNVELSARRF